MKEKHDVGNRSNGALSQRRWRQYPQERDDIPADETIDLFSTLPCVSVSESHPGHTAIPKTPSRQTVQEVIFVVGQKSRRG
jgi:hypothetical protein